ncbi:MAG: Peptidase and chymotrypsin/Hap [Deltaproteobacteria bacterium]|nr:Peptidase and chymotrypsin/Hap [Deltaproteobacteria bacterium]
MRAMPLLRVVTSAVGLIGIPALVHAEDHHGQPTRPAFGETSEVVGGTDAPLGKWPDAAAMLFNGQQACTGTLIAPTIALTAGHCDDPALTQILVGTASLDRSSDGETLPVTRRVVLDGADMTVLVLGTASRFAPRAIATGWAGLDIANGAAVEIVGYGATDRQASQFKAELQEVASTVTDFNCSTKAGCLANELGAGGNGIDSCNGDSGGPLYLVTSYGNFLVGVTSRAYADATAPCGEGGIYGRPDEVLAEIEQAAGVPVTHGPEPTFDPLVAIRGDAGETQIVDHDPRSSSHSYALTTPPTMATAKVRQDGRIRVCVNPTAAPGASDFLVVTVTDTGAATRSLAVKVPISVAANDAVDGTCDVETFDDEGGGGGGGCCESGRSAGGALPLTLFVLVALRRRRR